MPHAIDRQAGPSCPSLAPPSPGSVPFSCSDIKGGGAPDYLRLPLHSEEQLRVGAAPTGSESSYLHPFQSQPAHASLGCH